MAMVSDPAKLIIERIPSDSGHYGLSFEDNIVKLGIPWFYSLGIEEDCIELSGIDASITERIMDFLKTFSLMHEEYHHDGFSNTIDDGEFPNVIDSFNWIIRDYLENGIPYHKTMELTHNINGTLYWKRTIQKNNPILINRKVFFQEPVFRTRSRTESIYTIAFEAALYESVRNLGWFYNINLSDLRDVALEDDELQQYRIMLTSELDNTFNDNKRVRTLHVLNVLFNCGIDPINIEQDNHVNMFHSIFEKMIDDIFGSGPISRYYPSAVYHIGNYDEIASSDITEGIRGFDYSASKLRPDCIHFSEDRDVVTVIDSKYYHYFYEKCAKNLPNSSDVMKQVEYGERVKILENEMGHMPCVLNCFIIPFKTDDDRKMKYIGHVTNNWHSDETYNIVYIIAIDLTFLIKSWNQNCKEELVREFDRIMVQLKEHRL